MKRMSEVVQGRKKALIYFWHHQILSSVGVVPWRHCPVIEVDSQWKISISSYMIQN